MKRKELLFLMPVLGLCLTSCSNSFPNIGNQDHGGFTDLRSSSCSQTIVETFVDTLADQLGSKNFEKYKTMGTDYKQTVSSSRDGKTLNAEIYELSKSGYGLRREVHTYGQLKAQLISFTDASVKDNAKVYADFYVDNDGDLTKKLYYSEETAVKERFTYLSEYYENARMNYLEQMDLAGSIFGLIVLLAGLSKDDETFEIEYLKNEATFEYTDKSDEKLSGYTVKISDDTSSSWSTIYTTPDYIVRYVSLGGTKTENKVTEETLMTITLFQYDKEIEKMDMSGRTKIEPSEFEDKLFEGFPQDDLLD